MPAVVLVLASLCTAPVILGFLHSRVIKAPKIQCMLAVFMEITPSLFFWIPLKHTWITPGTLLRCWLAGHAFEWNVDPFVRILALTLFFTLMGLTMLRPIVRLKKGNLEI
ncbi:MAG: hypothetical protein C4582_07215 [Desulfobacteraceae bacterium]|nr:MAG: hypothetical protein C4582_07215 [Desulfobacteraceae bacterium]